MTFVCQALPEGNKRSYIANAVYTDRIRCVKTTIMNLLNKTAILLGIMGRKEVPYSDEDEFILEEE